MWPDYYCRCSPNDAFDLAAAAMISSFKPGEGYEWAKENMMVDGEADYTITAMILDPPDEDSEDPDYQEIAESNGYCVIRSDRGFAWGLITDPEAQIGLPLPTESEAWEACCDDENLIDESDDEMWCNVNGAWMLIEVFPCDDDFEPDHCRNPVYDSLADCFGEEVLKLAAE
jgi:hypothetical protein